MGIRVLVIEDDTAIADFLTRGLREEGFNVVHAPDGREGRFRLKNETWDVVLLDWWLPGVDGVTLLRQFRDAGGESRVLMLTARDAVSDRVTGLDSGADDYLCKPFAFEELLARVRSLARRQDQRSTQALSGNDVRVDLAAHRATRSGKLLDLTIKEQSLLTFFLRHPGQVLSRSRIYEQVWDERYDGLSNTLEVHIMELRKKLEEHGPRLIFTVRGRGYVFGKEPAT
jgi:two-component system, OmpR family, copper resistance phosphate regulon response regulator CusR